MIDYKTIWSQWTNFFEKDFDVVKPIINSFHIEVQNGFNVITSLSLEQLDKSLNANIEFKKAREDIESALLFSVIGGYLLFLISTSIDPFKNKLRLNEKTSRLGEAWMNEYKKDQTLSYILKIEPIVSLFLEKGNQSRINILLIQDPRLWNVEYKNIKKIEQFINWASYQGYILGLLEQSLVNTL
jgi:hypothetical protein